MKNIIFLILSTLAIAGCALSILPESAHADPVFDLSHVSKADIIATLKHQQQNEHDAEARLGQSQVDLTASQQETKAVQKAADDLQRDRDRLLQENQDLVDSVRALKLSIEKKDRKLDLLGWALAIVAAGFVFEVLGRLVIVSLAPQLLAARLISAGITFAAVFAWVRYF